MPAHHHSSLLKIELPVAVRIGAREMPLREILNLAPGSIIELDKPVDDDLHLLANGRTVAAGRAVKVGDHFGIRITRVGGRANGLPSSGLSAAPT